MEGKLIIYLVLCMFVGTVLGCPCFPKSDKKKYCLADFVMKVRVQSRLINAGGLDAQHFDAFYRIRTIQRPWKLVNEKAVENWRRLYTGSNDELCGVLSLRKGTVYLITGSVDTFSGQLRVNACSSIIQETPLRSYKRWKRKPPKCLEAVTPLWPASSFYL